MCNLLILKLDLSLNVSDFTLIGERWVHFLFNERNLLWNRVFRKTRTHSSAVFGAKN
jgi:hypothetical protein